MHRRRRHAAVDGRQHRALRRGAVEGDPVIFEYTGAEFRQRAFWSDVRPSMFWQARVTDTDSPGKAAAWARQIQGVLAERGLVDARIGIDMLDYNGYAAFRRWASSSRTPTAPCRRRASSSCRTKSS